MHGRTPATMAEQRRRRARYEFLHVAIDDCSRVAYVEVLPDEKGSTTADFLGRACEHFAEYEAKVEAILTDQAFYYTRSHLFRQVLTDFGIRQHTTRPYRPQTNGKAERFIRTLLQEWAYAELYRTNERRLALLPDWLSYYNNERPHTALKGSSPMPFLVNKVGAHYSWCARSTWKSHTYFGGKVAKEVDAGHVGFATRHRVRRPLSSRASTAR